MKRIILVCALAALATVIFSAPPDSSKMPQPGQIQQLELFGVPLKDATRDQLRQVFKRNGMQVTREDDRHWIDAYETQAESGGSAEFLAGYVDATDRFAFAAYTFSGFMDTQLVARVIYLVSMKYGRPSSQSGNYDLGPVRAEWDMGQGMGIMVYRGWPDTTTSLIYRDAAAYQQMRAEMETVENEQERLKSNPQEKTL